MQEEDIQYVEGNIQYVGRQYTECGRYDMQCGKREYSVWAPHAGQGSAVIAKLTEPCILQ